MEHQSDEKNNPEGSSPGKFYTFCLLRSLKLPKSIDEKAVLDFHGHDDPLESTDFSNLIEGAESMADLIEPAINPDDYIGGDDSAKQKIAALGHDLTPPQKNNYMYMDESEGEGQYGYPDNDYYNELGEGELAMDDEDSDYPMYGEGEDEGDDGGNAIDQLKKVFMNLKGEEPTPEKKKEVVSEEVKEVPPETPKQKSKYQFKTTYREDEEKAPFTPL